MKNTLYLIFAIFIAISGFSQTTPDTLWTKTIGGSSFEGYGAGLQNRVAIALSPDEKSVYIASCTYSHDGFVSDSLGSLDGWLVKLDSETGDTIWTDVVGGTYFDMITDVIATSDGGCVICGYSNSLDGDFANTGLHLNASMPTYIMNDGFIAKYSASGEIEWIKMYGGRPVAEETSTGTDELYKIIATKDGGYMATGYTYSTSDDLPIDLDKYRGGWLLKVDKNGNIEHSDKFVGEHHEAENGNIFFDIVETKENMYYVIGEQRYSIFNPDTTTQIWIVKTEGKEILEEKEYGSTATENYACSIVKGSDGTLFAVGSVTSATGDVQSIYDRFDIWLFQIDEGDLSLLDQKTLGGTESDFPYQLVQDEKGHFLMTAYTSSYDNDAFGGFGATDFWAVNFDENLDTLQTYKIGGTNNDLLTDAVFSKDGKNLYLAGLTFSNDYYVHNPNGDKDIWIAKIVQDETISVENILADNDNLKIFPNPSAGIFNIINSTGENIKITDICGKIIFTDKIKSDNQQIDISEYKKGIYFIEFSNNITQKIIIN